MAKTSRTRDTDAIKELAGRIRPASDAVNRPFKGLFYGPNGSGKTRLVASAPKPLILDIGEEGDRSIIESNAKVLPLRSWDDVGHSYWLLKGLLDKGKCPWLTVGIDTVTAMNTLAMSFVLEEAEDRDPSREKSTPTKRDYGRTGELVKAMIAAYRNLDMNVIFLAQVRTIKDDDTGQVIEYAVDLPAGSRATATGLVSVVGFMESKEVKVRDPKTKKIKRKVVPVTRTQPTDMDGEFPFLKDRTNNLAPLERNLTMPKVLKAWANTPQED